ncbi:MAG: HlyD family efflux transporter periplasmic adaptor subunit [Proteobacteria bacterium]|nr:HlyD family efflux transporter periplasmic adaptor subunit [Pseudomonadota bacterium]
MKNTIKILFVLNFALLLSLNAEESKASKKIKFYRNPMNPAITSPVFMKDDMGMDYIPVYEEEAEEDSKDDKIKGRASFKLSDEEAANVGLIPFEVKEEDISESIKSSGRAISNSTLVLQVQEADLSKLKVGLKVEAQSPSTMESIEAKIVNIDSILDPMTRSVRVVVSLKKALSSLRPESSVLATIFTEAKSGILIPANAVIRTGNQDLVYLIDGKKISPRKVKLGSMIGDSIHVISGLKSGDIINSHSNFLLDSEARIRGAND